jgi:hypothetical protein
MEKGIIAYLVITIRRDEAGKNGDGIKKNQGDATGQGDFPLPEPMPKQSPRGKCRLGFDDGNGRFHFI